MTTEYNSLVAARQNGLFRNVNNGSSSYGIEGRQYFLVSSSLCKSIHHFYEDLYKLLGPLLFKEVRNQEPKKFLLKEYLDSRMWAGTLIPDGLCRN